MYSLPSGGVVGEQEKTSSAVRARLRKMTRYATKKTPSIAGPCDASSDFLRARQSNF